MNLSKDKLYGRLFLRKKISFLLSTKLCRVPFIRDGLIAVDRTDRKYINTAKSLKDVQILEVGCGAGILTEVRQKF